MGRHTIEIQIDDPFRLLVSPEPLREVAAATLVHEGVRGPCEVALVVTGDDVLQELNRRHLGIDAPTDVLAFPDLTRGPFVDAPAQPRYLGDIVISYPRAAAHAEDLGHDVIAELQLLVVHGTLHLLGYDDTVPQKRDRMWASQAEILGASGVEVDLPE
jgi:probable rRNA maturation factor